MGACTFTANYGQDTKRIKNPVAASEEPGEKAICWHQKQGTVHDSPAPNSTKAVDKPPKSPLRPDLRTNLNISSCKEPAGLSWGADKKTCDLLCSLLL